MSLVIETFRSVKTPWEVFQSVHASSRTCFFLDSPRHAPPNQVFSYIGMDPDLEIRLGEKVLCLEGERSGKYPAKKLFPVLKKILKKYQIPSPGKCPFFAGGFVGYFGYEAADLCDKIKFRVKSGPDAPRVYLGLFRDVIAYDHQKHIYYLVTQGRGNGEWGTRNEKAQKLFCRIFGKARAIF